MTITEFDSYPVEKKKDTLFNCCGSHQWVKSMLEILPVPDLNDLLEYAEENWYECNHADWLEAFENQARLGSLNGIAPDDLPRFAEKERKALLNSDDRIIEELQKANDEYEDTFGYMFISFAPGKNADILLKELKERLNNDPREEIQIAAAEQDKIIKGRLKRLFS